MRASPVVATISVSLAFQLIGCGGGPGNFTGSAVTPVPTVNVKAPNTAVAGTAFSIEWTSTDATSCSTTFSSDTGTSGNALVTATVAESVSYSVTCTGAGGSNTASATVNVSVPTAEGFWLGTTTNGRSLSGVVTKEGDYWLTYSTSGNGSVIGFYSGHSNQAMVTPPVGTFVSGDLREVNFNTGGTMIGKISSATYTAKSEITGSFEAVAVSNSGSATYTLNGSGTTTALGGSVTLSNLVWTGTGSAGITDSEFNSVTFSYTQNITSPLDSSVNGNVSGSLALSASGAIVDTYSGCTGTASVCSAIASLMNVPQNYSASPFDFTNPASLTWRATTFSTAPGFGTTTTVANFTATQTSFTPSGLLSISPDNFTLSTYNAAYESTPSLAAVMDNYTGTASAGTTQAANSTFNIAADGVISGAEGGSGCSYTGTTAIHSTGGNVYDVTLHVTACAAADDYAGVAVYDAINDKVTVTALNSTRDKGFMFTGIGANH